MAKKTGGVLVLGKNYEPTKIFEDNNNQHIDIMPGCNAQIYLHEQIKTELMMGVELRSGHGKYGLISTSPIIFSDENGQFVHVTNSNPNSIRLHSRDRFAQIFFYAEDYGSGVVLNNPEDVKNAARIISPKLKTLESYVLFKVSDLVLKPKQNFGTIDMRMKYSIDEVFEKNELDKEYILKQNVHHVVKLDPYIEIPKNMGILLLRSIPYKMKSSFNFEEMFKMQFNQRLKAGWGDSGFKGNLTAHPYMWGDYVIKKGEPFALGLIYLFSSDAARSYGSDGLNSNHQNTKGNTLSA